MDKEKSSKYLKKFGDNVKNLIAKYQPQKLKTRAEKVAAQKALVYKLFALEDRFRNLVWKHNSGRVIFNAFCEHVLTEKRSLLDARPYFRERQKVFTAKISGALKNKDLEVLRKCHYNFRFVDWVLRQRRWRQEFYDIANAIKAIRDELAVTNLPLAIQRAKIHHKKIQRDHLEYIDYVQTSTEGLMAAIDKYTPPANPDDFDGIAGVAIGRSVGSLIEQSSETLLRFVPDDRRKLYRAHGEKRANPDIEPEELAKKVNEGIKNPGGRTNKDEIVILLQAASHVSADYSPEDTSEKGRINVVKQFEDTSGNRPDSLTEDADLENSMIQAVGQLTIFEQKFLRLKGVGV